MFKEKISARYLLKRCIAILFIAALLYGGLSLANDDNSHFTNVGNIGLTITNFGSIGHGFTLWPSQPNCEYPKGSGIEHIFDGGLWVGGVKSGVIRVSTGAIDANYFNRGEGFEYTNELGQVITQKSSLTNSPYYSPDAISHQDFLCEYTDTNTTIGGQIIVNHTPMGIKVIQSSYAWNYPYADFFVILRYRIVNIGYRGDNSPITNLYIGMWNDFVVRNTQITRPSGSSFYTHGGNGWDSTYNLGYEFDSNGDVGFTNSYVGLKFLGSTPRGSTPQDTAKVPGHYVTWQFRNTVDPKYFEPLTDQDNGTQLGRYSKMKGFFTGTTTVNPQILAEIRQPSNRSTLVTAGPYVTLNYLDTIEVAYGIICAKKTGTDPQSWDSTYQRADLHNHADWCQRAYDAHYSLPAPPDIPKVKVVNESKKVSLYWTANSIFSVDPISHARDFEGFRIYRTNAGADIDPSKPLTASFILAGDFDSINNIGNNTGFNYIKLSQPATFQNDTNHYWFRFTFDNLLNGWQYAFAVTAYDKGDTANDLVSLESSLLANTFRILPGVSAADDESTPIGVYPNPYYGHALWDGGKERERKIYFFNLPEKCEINIYTVSGDKVAQLTHDASAYNGSDIQWFNSFGDGTQILASGEHAWDLITKNDQAIATGLYLFTVKNLKTGFIKKGKFLVIK
jgi:hypothetical protein